MRRWALLLALTLTLSGCAAGPEKPALPRYEATFLTLFDTVTTVVGYNADKQAFTAQAQFIHDELEQYHRLYDIYHGYPGVVNLKTVNDRAGGDPVAVDRRIIDLLKEVKEMHARTGGRVNAAFGSVLTIWHDYRDAGIDDPEAAELPPMEKLREAAAHTEIENLEIDEAAGTVRLADPEMRLDVGAIAKGYATEQVCRAAREQGYESLLVSVGGNVRAVGGMDEKNGWRVGIQNPDSTEGAEKYLCRVALRDASLVTSGSYQRYYTVDGKEYHHIIDPDTLMPADYFWAVSVIASDSGIADALSTALYNLPYEQGRALAESFGAQVLWVEWDGSLRQTDGFSQYIIA